MENTNDSAYLSVTPGSAEWLETLEADIRRALDYSDPYGLSRRTLAAVNILRQLKAMFRTGSSISATDSNGRVLELLPDGTVHGGLTISPNTRTGPTE